MIGYLRGRLAVKQPPRLVIDVGGVGYELEAPMSTFFELPATGADVTLLTHLRVSEDAHTLYGFATEAERGLFRQLLKVTGVGARTALALLSGMSREEFVGCVQAREIAPLVKVPGIGRKTAERLIVEMRDRLDEGAFGELRPVPAEVSGVRAEAFGALVALGYKPAEVSRMLSTVDTAAGSTEDVIRQVLRSLA